MNVQVVGGQDNRRKLHSKQQVQHRVYGAVLGELFVGINRKEGSFLGFPLF